MNSDREKLAIMKSSGDELVFFVNGKKVNGYILWFHSLWFISPLSKALFFWTEQLFVIFIYCRFWNEMQSQKWRSWLTSEENVSLALCNNRPTYPCLLYVTLIIYHFTITVCSIRLCLAYHHIHMWLSNERHTFLKTGKELVNLFICCYALGLFTVV